LRVLQRDLRHGPVYPLLAECYERQEVPKRALRVRELTWLLGYGGPEGLGSRYARTTTGSAADSMRRPLPRRGVLTDELRRSKLLPRAIVQSRLLDLLLAMREGIERLFPTPWPLPYDTTPLAGATTSPGFADSLATVNRLLGIASTQVSVLVAPHVPGFVQSLTVAPPEGRSSPGPLQVVVLAASALQQPDAELRYLLGRALEPLRCGYAPLLRLSESEAERVVRLATALLAPQSEFDAATWDFWQQLSPAAQQKITEIQAARAAPPPDAGQDPTPTHSPPLYPMTVQECLGALPLCADRAGLLAADDLVASIYMMARAQGQDYDEPASPSLAPSQNVPDKVHSQVTAKHAVHVTAQSAVTPREPASETPSGKGIVLQSVDVSSGILLGQVFGGAELARYYLSDSYNEIMAALADTSRL
jgi:hypothetical protein